jgi:hypothetical protein
MRDEAREVRNAHVFSETDIQMLIDVVVLENENAGIGEVCQSASKIDPRSASKIDPLGDEELTVALAPAELVGVVEPGRARWV